MVPFDPYLNWLGIPPHEQPVNYYRLLGLVLFESNPQAIVQAADRQSLRVGSFQSGPQNELCQQLLSEIAMVQFCLLDPQQKAAYDAQLQETLTHRGERTVAAAPPPFSGAPSGPGMPIPGMAAMSRPPMSPPQPMVPAMPDARRPNVAGSATTMMATPPGFAPTMSAPAAIPVAAPFPVPAPMARPVATSGTAVATPSLPPAAPPSAPPRPIDELEALASQPTRRRRLIGRKKKTDYSRQILIGSVVGVTGVLLLIVYLAFGNRPAGYLAIPAEIEKPPESLRTKIAADEAKERKKIAKEKDEKAKQEKAKQDAAAHAAASGEKSKSDKAGPLRAFTASAKDSKSNAAEDDGQSLPHVHDFGPAPRAMDSPAGGGRVETNPPRGHDVTPDQLGGDDDPVMGKDVRPEK